ncbi:CdaR family transcriptional regulator [Collinsella tanakaei]|uniref:CdaR family transcriptional regulator n=1 Tax=Collinsella tanakaei TaxID=626935 RepID=UPI0025A34F3F|nr:sugar diacid recognition domain-containing protein [Collinsella tanakaei]MDM8301980.1 sugar diacid recognition domain-containing protein [Collinsella tanakaei]
MNLDPHIAETIVTTLKDVINHEINLFDTTGTIIASTVRSRIGTGHDGARLAIRTKQTVAINDEHEFRGAKHGINVPVVFNDSVVAVIGITGERAEVEPLGNVIKKMTEILIRENWDLVVQYDQRARVSNLVSMLKLKHHDDELVAYYGSILRIDLNRPRIAIVGRADFGEDEIPDYDSIYSMLHARFQQLKTSFFAISEREVCLFVDERDERAVSSLLEGIREDAKRTLRKSIRFGIGMAAESSSDYWRSYDEACRALEWIEFSNDTYVGRYDSMDLGLIVSSVPREEAERLVDHVFHGLSDDEIDAFQVVFEAYSRHNGSIVHCADELFLHKNTLQNRLNKIADKTGYNPRKLPGFAVLTMAFLLRRYLKRSR